MVKFGLLLVFEKKGRKGKGEGRERGKERRERERERRRIRRIGNDINGCFFFSLLFFSVFCWMI